MGRASGCAGGQADDASQTVAGSLTGVIIFVTFQTGPLGSGFFPSSEPENGGFPGFSSPIFTALGGCAGA